MGLSSRQGATMQVYDATFFDDSTIKRDAPLWPSAYPGTTRSLMLGSVISPSGKAAESFDVLRIADACKRGEPFTNYNFSPPGLSTGPRVFGMVNLDLEIPAQDFSPDAMFKLIAPIAAKYPVSVCWPDQVVVLDDGPLKQSTWPQGSKELEYAKAWAAINTWAAKVWAIEVGIYMGKPEADDSTITLIRNRIRLARCVYPGKRVIATLWAERNESFGGKGIVPADVLGRLVNMLRAEHCESVQVWGTRPSALFKALGV